MDFPCDPVKLSPLGAPFVTADSSPTGGHLDTWLCCLAGRGQAREPYLPLWGQFSAHIEVAPPSTVPRPDSLMGVRV